MFADTASHGGLQHLLGHAFVAAEGLEGALALLERSAGWIGLRRGRRDPADAVLFARYLRPHAIGPALRLAQIHVEARQEIAPENVVREIGRASCRERVCQYV